jgi:hypothetical protein
MAGLGGRGPLAAADPLAELVRMSVLARLSYESSLVQSSTVSSSPVSASTAAFHR